MNEHLRSIVESIEAIAKQRDDARAEAERLHAALASDGEAMANLCGLLELTDAVASREEGQQMVHAAVEKLKAERDALREASRALLVNLDDGNSVYWCGERAMGNAYCSRAQTKTHHGRSYCDEHAPAGAVDTPNAPALRRLRALLEVKS